jgi:hypothetical protein
LSRAVVGGGMAMIANAPNPAGQALLSRFFGGSISPLGLAGSALIPTLVAAVIFPFLVTADKRRDHTAM